MKSFVVLIFVSFCFSAQALATANCNHDDSIFRCVSYVRNYDGDTVTFNIPNTHPLFGREISVRILGIDTPERRSKNSCEKSRATETKAIVAKFIQDAKQIDLVNVQRDKYFRILADVIADGKSLSQYLLQNGHAYPYDGGTKKVVDWCRPAREIASERK